MITFSGGRDSEYLRTVHSTADCHVTVDGGHSAHWHRGVSDAAGRAVTAGRFPDHPGAGEIARRQPRDHGIVRGNSARISICSDTGCGSADVFERTGDHADHSAVRPGPE